MPTTHDPELAREQAYVDTLYARFDELRDYTANQLRGVLLDGGTGTPQSVVERDVFAATHAERLARLDAAEGRLCFGAMDHRDGLRTYIGRIGLSDTDHQSMLVDWRAPVATAFYRATLADPLGLRRRRHLRTKGREVTGVADDVLGVADLGLDGVVGAVGAVGAVEADGSPASVSVSSPGSSTRATGDSLLLEALTAPRTGRMHDIVTTLQAEQDRIIRGDARSVLVVDGGPGTGKTAVALHRAAYLLYSERERLARSGVLVVGPNPMFLRYIEQVLPSLGETGVVFATPGRLFPGVEARGSEDVAVARLKGELRMADLVAAAVRDRQTVPRRTVEILHDDVVLRLDPAMVSRARTKARRSRRPHNAARRIFVREVLSALTDQAVAQVPGGLMDASERREIMAGIVTNPEVSRRVGAMWPRLTPQRLLTELFDSPARLGSAGTAAELTREEWTSLAREPDSAWTPADVPLLDEAAELLGDPDAGNAAAAARRAAAERDAETRYAKGVLDILGLTGSVDAEALAQRWSGPRRRRSVVEYAEDDREWAYGHLVVDEAQDVSPLLWRLLWRRCPGQTATLVGDLAQAASRDAAASWDALLRPHVGDRFRVERLSVNYRTPEEIMDLAGDVLAAQNPGVSPPVSVRSAGVAPVAVPVGPDGDVVEDVVAAAVTAAGSAGDGRVAVICPDGLVDHVRGALAAHAPSLTEPDLSRGGSSNGDPLDARVAVLSVADCKGLEFDVVVLAEPAAILDGPNRGLADLYVALTRATRTLTVVYSGELPAVLGRLTSSPQS